jgi:carboxyl-terminal processing protease
MKLKEQQVDGIIMDLRNNGGGSLYDVVQIAGFFIPEGPIVQVKDREGNPNILRDRDKSVLYDGPLALMVNEFSASASEILAAAIQDYNRGIVVGSTSTYGKGTVQRNIGLEKEVSINQNSGSSDLGTIKLTLQKFYRINGGSTQLKGVTPNIIIPDPYEYLEYREKDNPDALPWDEIQKANYSPYNVQQYDLNALQNASIQRIKANPSFNAVLENQKLMEQANDKEVTLNLKKHQEEEKKIQENSKLLEKLRNEQVELSINFLPQDLKRIESDSDKLERRKQWGKFLSKDIYLHETVNVVNDMINKTALVANK